MTYLDDFLFGFYPYFCMVLYFFGSWVRFDRSQYTWRAQSSQLLRRKQLFWGSTLFHIGILGLFCGHFFGLLTPPVGLNCFVVARCSGQPVEDVFHGIFPHVVAHLIIIAVFVAFPSLVLWLPSRM